MNGWGIFLIIFFLAIILGFGGWVLYSRIRAQRLGLPAPSLNPFAGSAAANYPAPAPGGIRGWIEAQVRKFKNRRHATGAYEEPTTYAGARGRGAGHRLDPDEAWDAHVGNEAYYEEQELGLHPPATAHENTAYGGGEYGYGYTATVSANGQDEERGRSRSRGYEENLHVDRNPFGDDNAASLRGVSPRPLDTGAGTQGQQSQHKKKESTGSEEDSPTERRSIFRENM
jgi:hypothetical protein